MSDLDWMNIELQKDADNRYLFANLQGLVTPVLGVAHRCRRLPAGGGNQRPKRCR